MTSTLSSTAFAEEPDRSDTIFFATAVGGGVVWPDDVQFDQGPTPGGVWEVTFGWGLSRHWAVGVAFGTWQSSWLGLPFHLHNAFTPRIEVAPFGGDGLVLSLASGLGTTDGVRPPDSTHHGVAISPRVAYRWGLGDMAVSVVTGVDTHLYVDAEGSPLVVFVGGELRFYGDTGGQ